jgi:hypothetical protein
MNHSPEPWGLLHSHTNPPPPSYVLGHIVDGDDNRIFLSENGSNARRIVACVNACAGIPTERLEAKDTQIALVAAPDPLAPEIVEEESCTHKDAAPDETGTCAICGDPIVRKTIGSEGTTFLTRWWEHEKPPHSHPAVPKQPQMPTRITPADVPMRP